MWDIALVLPIEKAVGQTLQKQLQTRLRQIIRTGQLPALTQLPSSRVLAKQLSLSRNTVIAVYNQLRDEGYLYIKANATYVAKIKPIASFSDDQAPTDLQTASSQEPMEQLQVSLPFQVGEPALTHFPFTAWKRCLLNALHVTNRDLLNYGHPLGEQSLCEQIARHVSLTRGVVCRAEQVVITTGTQQALRLCTQLLTEKQENIWMEEPGYRAARAVFKGEGRKVHAIAVDSEGLAPQAEQWSKYPPKLIYTTPSHQFPTGRVMSIARRLALLHEARQHQAWIIEDDYDSEFRYQGAAIPAMQGLITEAPVIYVGSFSKVLAPAIGIGFMVIPEKLLPELLPTLMQLHSVGARHLQYAVASLMQHGEFLRHLSKMRRLYKERQTILRTALQPLLQRDPRLQLLGGYCGMHLLLLLPNDVNETKLLADMQTLGYAMSAFSEYFQQSPKQKGILLGYGNTSDINLKLGVEKLTEVYVNSCMS